MVTDSSLRLPVASEAARSRHLLMPSSEPARRVSATNGGVAAVLYPNFDRTPLPPINYGPGRSDSGSDIAATPSAPPLPQGQQVMYVSMFRDFSLFYDSSSCVRVVHVRCLFDSW